MSCHTWWMVSYPSREVRSRPMFLFTPVPHIGMIEFSTCLRPVLWTCFYLYLHSVWTRTLSFSHGIDLFQSHSIKDWLWKAVIVRTCPLRDAKSCKGRPNCSTFWSFLFQVGLKWLNWIMFLYRAFAIYIAILRAIYNWCTSWIWNVKMTSVFACQLLANGLNESLATTRNDRYWFWTVWLRLSSEHSAVGAFDAVRSTHTL